MNGSPKCRLVIASFTILASALSASLAGCSSKTNPAPAVQATGSPTAGNAPAPAPEPGLTLPRGTRLQVRLNQTISVKHVASGDRFTGTLAEPIVEGSTVAVPRVPQPRARFSWLT